MTFEELSGGIIFDTETGEIVDAAGMNDPMAHIARLRMEAKAQEVEWETYRRNLDRVLMRALTVGERIAYGDIVVSLRRSPDIVQTNGERFADELSGLPLELEDIWQIIGAARSFDPKKLPERAQAAYAIATIVKAGTDWADVRRVRTSAPARRERTEEEVFA
jgi:hypothetical protein